MLRPILFLQLALWAVTINAFYPWIPPPLRAKYTLHGGSEGEADRRAVAAPGTTTFKLAQRIRDTNADPSENAAREASRLLRKYGGLRPERTARQQSGLAKRKNEFSVVEPETPSRKKAVGIYQDGTDFSYFVEAKIGSRGTSLYMLLDTGAGITWVTGSECQASACKMHNSFTPADSPSSEGGIKGFSVAYGSGSVEGSLIKDSISLGNLKAAMTFGVANVTSDDFSHFPFDGILGLSTNTGPTDSYLQALKFSGAIDSLIFAVYINRNADGPNTGEISFGETNPSKFSGDISYTSLGSNADGSWAIPLDDVSYDGESAGIEGRLAYIDTGTSYAFGPQEDVEALHKLIPDSESSDGVVYTIPCDTDIPITLSFSGVDYNISTKDWHLSSPDGGKCTSAIYGRAVISDSWLLGDLFLKNVYAVFDAGGKRIGFASRAASSDGGDHSSTSISPAPTSGGDDSPSGAPLPGLTGPESSTTGASPTQTGNSSNGSSSVNQIGAKNLISIFAFIAMVCVMA